MKKILTLILIGSTILSLNCDNTSSDKNPNPGPSPDSAPSIVGTWASCEVLGTRDWQNVYTFSATGFSVNGYDYWGSSDGTCGGAATAQPVDDATYDYTAGVSLSGSLNGSAVTVYELDVTPTSFTGPSVYTVYYIDSSVTPNVLYLGIYTWGGDTPANRWTVLNTKQLVKQP